MWKANAGRDITDKNEPVEDDDWETDPDYINDVSEEEQRWGLKSDTGRTAGTIEYILII